MLQIFVLEELAFEIQPVKDESPYVIVDVINVHVYMLPLLVELGTKNLGQVGVMFYGIVEGCGGLVAILSRFSFN